VSQSITIPNAVTVCVTSCGRIDLLDATLKGFQRYNKGGRYLISEDSTDANVIARVKDAYPEAQVLSGSTQLGLMGSIDRLYSAVTTPYIFHLEDDWDFDGPVDWTTAIEVLKTHPEVSQVCVRDLADIKPKWQKGSRSFDVNGVTLVQMHPKAHPEWFGWTSNPGLIRREMYEAFQPFARVYHDTMSGLIKKGGQHVAYMTPGVARHAGQGRNVTDPQMPPRPKNKLAKLARKWKKTLYYWGLRDDPF
jgi:hypothetical protein